MRPIACDADGFAYDEPRMRAVTEVRLLQTGRVIATGLLSIVGCIVPVELGGPWTLLGSAVGALVGWKLSGAIIAQHWSARLLGRAHARLGAAFADASRMRTLYEDLAAAYRALDLSPDRSLRMQLGLLLIGEERWSEARAVMQELTPSSQWSLDETLTFENNLAWILAHDGAATEAVAQAERALARVARHPLQVRPELVAYMHGTLGTALLLDGRPADAVPWLRRAIAAGGSDLARATRHYYLGTALAALAQLDDARQAWTKACTLAPTTRWAQLADRRLAEPEPAPYR